MICGATAGDARTLDSRARSVTRANRFIDDALPFDHVHDDVLTFNYLMPAMKIASHPALYDEKLRSGSRYHANVPRRGSEARERTVF